MGKTIIWRKKALDSIDKIAEYLLNEWGQKVRIDFSNSLTAVINNISEFPEAGKQSEEIAEYRKLLITKHSFLVYSIETNNTIIIIDVQDTRQNPDNFNH